METKKLTRFSLEDWQANPKRKVVTDDGREVRIVCVDREWAEKLDATRL